MKHLTRDRARVVFWGLLFGLLIPVQAAAHLGLESSSPAKGDTLRTSVSTIHLTFTQRIELRFTSVMIVTAAGDTIRGALAAVDTTGRDVELTLPRPLLDGNYVVVWRAAGNDGHAVTGNFDFMVVGLTPPAVMTPPLEAGVPNGVPPMETSDVNQQPLAIALRWLNFLVALLLTGGVVVQLLSNGVSKRQPSEYWMSVSQSARKLAIVAAIVSLLLSFPRLALQVKSLSGPGVETGMIGALLRETNWGQGWVLQLLGSAGYLLAMFAAAPAAVAAWLLAGAASVMVAFGLAFSGHAAGVEQMQIINIANDALHVVAVSAWIGTLAYVVVIALPIALRQRSHGELGALIRAFSPLALGAAAIAVITGSVSALSHLGPLSDLWTTDYGRMLLLKLVGVMGVAISGAYNWRRLKPRLGTEPATGQLQRSAAAETGLALLVLLATAILVALPTP